MTTEIDIFVAIGCAVISAVVVCVFLDEVIGCMFGRVRMLCARCRNLVRGPLPMATIVNMEGDMGKNKRRARRKAVRNGCTGKVKYQTRELATHGASTLVMTRRGVRRAAVYVCPRCAHFHVTSKPGREWLVMVEEDVTAA